MSALRPEDGAACGAGEAGSCFAGAGAAGAGPGASALAGAGAAASALSITAITLPSLPLSPSLTFSSLIVPACAAGTSIVALSDSSVTRPWSLATVSPALTSSSITGTSSKPPMSGTFSSIVAIVAASEHGPAQVAEQLRQVGGEARGGGAVDHAVVVAQRQRQHQPRLEGLAVPDRLRLRLRHAEDRDFRRVDDRGERGAADAAQRADGEAAALHLVGFQLALARQRGEFAHFPGDLHHALLGGIAQDRHHQAIRGVGGEADVVVALEDEVVAVQRGVERRVLLQRGDAGLDQEGEHGQLAGLAGGDRLGVLAVQRDAQRLELGDVGVVVLGDVRDHRPVARRVGAGDLLDARQRLAFDLAELREVDLRPRDQLEAAPATAGPRRARRGAAGQHRLDVLLHVLPADPAAALAAGDP